MKLAWSYIKRYFSRSLSIGLSIVFSIALIIGVGILSDSAKEATINQVKYEVGNYHVKYTHIDEKKLKSMSNDKISKIAVSSYYDSNEFDGKLMMNLVKANEDYLDIFNSNVINGKFPTDENEVALENWVMLNLGVKLNQEINIDLHEVGKSKRYKIVGVLKDRPSYKSKGLVEAILPLDKSENENFNIHIQFEKDKNVLSEINKISKELSINSDNIRINNILLDALGETENISYIFLLTCIIAIIVSGIVIYSIFSISIVQRISEYGTLRAIGGNIYDIFKFIFLELLLIALIYIPIGVLIGIFGAKALSYTVGNLFTTNVVEIKKLKISTILILFSIAITIINLFIISIKTCININKITPIDCIRKNIDKRNYAKSNILDTKLLMKIFTIDQIISLKNLTRNKKSFILIIISMSMGCIIFILTSFVNKLDEGQLNYASKVSNENSDYNISFAPVTPLKTGMSDNDIKDIENIEGIKTVSTSQVMYSRMELDSKDINNFKYFDEINEKPYNKKALNGLFVKCENNYILKNNIYGYDKNNLNAQKPFITSGNVDMNKMEKENVALIYIPKSSVFTKSKDTSPVLNLKVGDTVKVKFRKDTIADEKFATMEDEGEYIESEFVIGGIVDNIVNIDSYYTGMDSSSLIISQEQFKKITNIDSYRMVDIEKYKNFDNEILYKKIIKICERNQGAMVRDFTQEIKDMKILEDNKMILIYSIIIILFIISLFNITNNVSYSLISRTNEFGIIRSIGLCDKNFKKMIIFEGLVYGILSSIVTIIGGIVGQVILFRYISPNLMNPKFIFNINIYLIVICLNMIIGIIATYAPLKKINKLSIVESINHLE